MPGIVSVIRRVGMPAMVFALLAGCDSAGGVGASSAPAEARAQPDSAMMMTLVLPADPTAVQYLWEAAIMSIAGDEKAIYQLEKPEPQAPAQRQADMIRTAAKSGTSAMIVVAQDPKVVAPALDEVRASGMPVVLLGRDVPSPSGKPFTYVAYESAEKAARRMFEATRKAAKAAGLSPDGPAALVVKSPRDPETTPRMEALRKVITESGVKLLPDIEYLDDAVSPSDTYRRALKLDPKPTMLFGDEDLSVTAMCRIRSEEDRTPHAPMVGGFISQKRNRDVVAFNQAAAVVDANSVAPAARAVTAALELASGKELPARVEIPLDVLIAGDPTHPVNLRPPSLDGRKPQETQPRVPNPGAVKD